MNDKEIKDILDAIDCYKSPEEKFVERLLLAFVCGMIISSSIVIIFIT